MSGGEALDRELGALARLLGHRGATAAFVARYGELVAREAPVAGAERRLQLWALRRGGLLARMASAWAARCDRHGPLRRREVMMLALLECRPESMAAVDRTSDGGPIAAWPRFFLWGLTEVVYLLLALPLFLPARLLGGRP